MIATEEKTMFVSVCTGFTCPEFWMVATVIYKGESINQTAKKMRKEIADHPNFHGWSDKQKPFNPSQIMWAVFENINDTIPVVCSKNWNPRENWFKTEGSK